MTEAILGKLVGPIVHDIAEEEDRSVFYRLGGEEVVGWKDVRMIESQKQITTYVEVVLYHFLELWDMYLSRTIGE